MNPTIVEEDKAIDFGDLYGLSGHPLQHRGYALESNGSRIKWVFDLSGTFLLDGGRECGVGNVVAFRPEPGRNAAGESLWYGVVIRVYSPQQDYLAVARLMSTSYLYAMSRDDAMRPLNWQNFQGELNDAEIGPDSTPEQILSSRHENVAINRIFTVLSEDEFRGIGFNNSLRVLCSYSMNIMNIDREDYFLP